MINCTTTFDRAVFCHFSILATASLVVQEEPDCKGASERCACQPAAERLRDGHAALSPRIKDQFYPQRERGQDRGLPGAYKGARARKERRDDTKRDVGKGRVGTLP